MSVIKKHPVKNLNRKCKQCDHFVYMCHHHSFCRLKIKINKIVSSGNKDGLRDGKALACEKFKPKKEEKKDWEKTVDDMRQVPFGITRSGGYHGHRHG